jgi:hypothetical protein
MYLLQVKIYKKFYNTFITIPINTNKYNYYICRKFVNIIQGAARKYGPHRKKIQKIYTHGTNKKVPGHYKKTRRTKTVINELKRLARQHIKTFKSSGKRKPTPSRYMKKHRKTVVV